MEKSNNWFVHVEFIIMFFMILGFFISLQCDMKDFHTDMKDFHGRLVKQDAEFKGRIALQDAEFKSHMIYYHSEKK